MPKESLASLPSFCACPCSLAAGIMEMYILKFQEGRGTNPPPQVLATIHKGREHPGTACRNHNGPFREWQLEEDDRDEQITSHARWLDQSWDKEESVTVKATPWPQLLNYAYQLPFAHFFLYLKLWLKTHWGSLDSLSVSLPTWPTAVTFPPYSPLLGNR